MLLGDFKILLRRAHKRGAALDADLDGAIRRAANWVESNYTLSYMKRTFSVEVSAGDTEIELEDLNLKTVLGIRWNVMDAYGKPQVCRKVEFEDVDASLTGAPSQFYMDGERTLVFGQVIYETLTGAGRLTRFSDFPIEDDESHWLLRRAESLMLVQSMLELGIIARDDRSYQMFLSQREDQIRVLMNADYETSYAGQDISLNP